ncbi:MAG: PAS domain-containing protein [Sandaracinaceae bacterium]|nr:PAS domain-containing protein [Sandaracinaceae bacterium]
MKTDPTSRLDGLTRENEVLRNRVLELERALARVGTTGPSEPLGRSLDEREALLAECENVGRMGSWIWDVQGDRVHWSEGLHRILGYDSATHTPSTEAFYARVHPDDVMHVRAAAERTVTTGASEHVSYRVLLPDGTVRHVGMDSVFLFDEEGTLRRAVGTVVDVTDREEAAREVARARWLLDETERFSSTGSWEWKLPQGTVTWSKGMYRLLGFDESEPASFELWDAAVHPDDHPHMADVRARAIATGRADPYECRFLRRDGTVRRLRVVGEPVYDASGESTGLIGTITDITAASEMEERVRQAQKMEMVGQLAGSIAHDFNNLLTVILGGVQEITRGQGASEMLTQVERAARSAAGLTQRLLGFSRQAVVQPEVVDLTRVIDDFRPLLGRALGAEVAVRVQHDDGEFLARLDENQLQQILMNLSVNARDAMGGRGTLTLSLARVTTLHGEVPLLLGGEYLRLTVSDTGHGMDPLTAQRIFEPFFTTKPIGKGTGLGLAMVEGAMKQAGGAVVVQTRLGEGTSFHLYFPPAPARASEHPPSPAMPGSLRVLLVEDDPCVRHALSVSLESIGCEVVAMDGGPAALEAWEQQQGQFDVLVTDLAMPDMRGEVLAATLLERSATLRAVLATGYVDRAIDLSAFEGRFKLLQKPVERHALAAALARL